MYFRFLRSVFFVFLIFPFYSFSQQVIGAKQAAMGYCGVTSTDVYSTFNNPAGVASLNTTSIGTYYENKFLLKELSYRTVCASFGIDKNKVIGVKMASYGFEYYHRSMIGGAFAMKLSEHVNAGIDIDYLDYFFGNEYGRTKRLTFGAGFQAPLTNELLLGVYTFNPFAFKNRTTAHESLTTLYRIGLEYKHDKLRITTEIEKEVLINYQFKAGVEYRLKEAICLRTGISSNPVLNTFGFGYKLKNIICDVACSYHQALGISPQIGLQYCFGKNGK